MRYRNLDLQIERDPSGGYVVQGKSSQGDFRDHTTGDLNAIVFDRGALAQGRLDEAALKVLGRQLFDFLFRTRTEAKLATLLDRSIGAVTEAEEGLRIRLQLDEANPDVAAEPWEYLYRSIDDRFLASQVQTPIVRFLEVGVPVRRMEARLPLAMLVVVPAVDNLNVDLEVSIIEEALSAMSGAVEMTVLRGIVTPQRLHEELAKKPYDVLHFIGHGDFTGQVATLRFNDESGKPLNVDHETVGKLVRNEQTLRLVVLNSCQGAQVSTSAAFVGMAPKLVAAGVPAVVAMQFPIMDKEALGFARAFYGALFEGEGRGSIDYAISIARNALEIAFPGGRAFGVPALFVRYDEGILFQVVTGKPIRDALMNRAEAEKQQAAIRELESNHRRVSADQSAADPEVRQQLAGQLDELKRGRQRLRLRTATIISAAVVALVAGLLFEIGLLSRLPYTWIVAASPVWFGDPVGKSLPFDSIAIVRARHSIDTTWRPRHAKMVDKLAAAGARVIVLDIWFERPMPGDSALVAAFTRARALGTAVVFGARSLEDHRPLAVPELAAVAAVGGACLGNNPRWFSEIIPLVWIYDQPPGPPVVVPSLALAAVAAWRRTTIVVDPGRVEVDLVDSSRHVVDSLSPNRVVELGERDTTSNCGMATPGSRYAQVLAARAPTSVWRALARHREYESVEADTGRLDWARGRIVMIGSVLDTATSRRPAGLSMELRYGVERQADAVATILSRRNVKPLRTWAELVIIAVAAAVGGWIGSRSRPSRRWQTAMSLGGALLAFGLVATIGYRSGRILIDILHPALALLLTWAVVSRLQRRWLV